MKSSALVLAFAVAATTSEAADKGAAVCAKISDVAAPIVEISELVNVNLTAIRLSDDARDRELAEETHAAFLGAVRKMTAEMKVAADICAGS